MGFHSREKDEKASFETNSLRDVFFSPMDFAGSSQPDSQSPPEPAFTPSFGAGDSDVSSAFRIAQVGTCSHPAQLFSNSIQKPVLHQLCTLKAISISAGSAEGY